MPHHGGVALPDLVLRLVAAVCLDVGAEVASGLSAIVLLEAGIPAEACREPRIGMRRPMLRAWLVGEDALDDGAEVAAEALLVDFVRQFAEAVHRCDVEHVCGSRLGLEVAPVERAVFLGVDGARRVGELGMPFRHLALAASARPVELVVEPDAHAEALGVPEVLPHKREPFLAHVLVFKSAARIDDELRVASLLRVLERADDVRLGRTTRLRAEQDERGTSGCA